MALLVLKNKKSVFSYRYSWVHLIRPLTLIGTIGPVTVGTLYIAQNKPIIPLTYILFLTTMLLIQITTNILNDYFDFKYGQDKEKWIHSCQTKKPKHHQLPFFAILLMVVGAILGLWLVTISFQSLLFIGFSGLLTGIFYSAGKFSFAAIGLGEITGALFLGVIPTTVSYAVQGGELNWQIILLSVPFACLISSMILTNNIRDIKKDLHFRRTIAIKLGRTRAIFLLYTLMILAYVAHIGLILLNVISPVGSIVLFALPLAVKLCKSFSLNKTQNEEHKAMKRATLHHWGFSSLFIVSLLISLF